MTTPDQTTLPPVRQPAAPLKRRKPPNHLSIRFGSQFEASAGGTIAVVLLGIVAVLFLVVPAVQQLLQ